MCLLQDYTMVRGGRHEMFCWHGFACLVCSLEDHRDTPSAFLSASLTFESSACVSLETTRFLQFSLNFLSLLLKDGSGEMLGGAYIILIYLLNRPFNQSSTSI